MLITVLRAARAPLLGASMLVAGAGSVGADPGAVSRVGVHLMGSVLSKSPFGE